MGRLKVLLFDMDGVLVDTTSLLKRSYTQLAEYLNVAHPTEPQLKRAAQLSPKKAISYLFEDERYQVLERFQQYWKANIKQASAFAGIRELMDELIARNVETGTVTSRNNSDALALLTATGLLSYTRTVVTWGRYRVAKPSPACLLVALSDIGSLASKTAYVGDQAIDMRAAKNAGVLAVGATWDPDANRNELEYAGADVIVERPQEIIELLRGQR